MPKPDSRDDESTDFRALEWHQMGVGSAGAGDLVQFARDDGSYPEFGRETVHKVVLMKRTRPDDEDITHVLADPVTGDVRDVVAEHDSNTYRVHKSIWEDSDE